MPWQPRNKYCWDFWFFQQGPTLHAFYLQTAKRACAYNPQKRQNIASIGHAVLTDFGWRELDPDKPALEEREGEVWDNLVIWTGSIIQQDDFYYLFYTAKSKAAELVETPLERRSPQNIGVAISKDLRIWTRTLATLTRPVIPNPGPASKFDGSNWRDPHVMRDDTDGRYYAFICAHSNESVADIGGVVAIASSSDLLEWQSQPYQILYRSDEFYLIETPQVFWRKMDDGYWRLYLLFGPHWDPSFEHQKISAGVTCYVRSQPIKDRSQASYDCIPWEQEPANRLSDNLYAGKLINPETNPYPAFFGFQKADASGHFMGGLSDPQWALFADDGTIRLSAANPSAVTRQN